MGDDTAAAEKSIEIWKIKKVSAAAPPLRCAAPQRSPARGTAARRRLPWPVSPSRPRACWCRQRCGHGCAAGASQLGLWVAAAAAAGGSHSRPRPGWRRPRRQPRGEQAAFATRLPLRSGPASSPRWPAVLTQPGACFVNATADPRPGGCAGQRHVHDFAHHAPPGPGTYGAAPRPPAAFVARASRADLRTTYYAARCPRWRLCWPTSSAPRPTSRTG